MTMIAESVTPPRMGRKKLWPERTAVKFPAGTFARVAAVLEEKEDRTDFFRKAVERELKRREREKQKPGRRR
jgi:hypothetical protein